MDLENRDKRDSQIYDSSIRGFDQSFWATISGTPSGSAGSGNVITLNAATITSYPQYEFVEKAEFMLTVPNAPTGGQAIRQWGFKSPSSNNLGAAYFQTSGAVFTAVVYDNFGNTQTKTLTWTGSYTATATRFQIMSEPERIMFKINDVIVATFTVTSGASPVALPFGALPIYISNGASDNMTITYIDLLHAANILS
jgi:hypothetical protein